MALVILALLAAVAGIALYRGQAESEQRRVLVDLDNIAQLKIRQATQWRDDRLSDAGMFGRGPLLWEALRERSPRLSERAEVGVTSYLTELITQYGYARCALVDPRGRAVASVSGRDRRVDNDLGEPLAQAFAARRPIMSDLVRSADSEQAYLLLVAPVYDGVAAGSGPLGALVLWADADDLLLNAVNWWPTASRSAETLLVRRDGESVLYLNRLRRAKDAAVKLRIPLSSTEVPSVRAVLGQRGAVRGLDYSGVRVLAALHEVPSTPWILITKVDESEALAQWQRRGKLLISLVALFVVALLGAAAGVQQIQSRYVSLARATDQLR
ncbi:MAG: hypothetical protein HZB16_10835, partial [Armatimonadetes bacterium]|nr:hypothetical protein [Armatimonadota bacterium]